jgi:hypothetical protein
MTEADWLKCENPHLMLEYLKTPCRATRRKSGQRKLRLFGCACCRRIWYLLADDRLRNAVVVAERFADGLATAAARKLARGKAISACAEAGSAKVTDNICGAVYSVLSETPWSAVRAWTFSSFRDDFEEQCRDRARQCVPLRCIFGNPFQPLSARRFPAHVVGLAESIYQAFPEVCRDNFLILADALSDLCEEQAAAHCREEEQVKGCHVVDWLLEK